MIKVKLLIEKVQRKADKKVVPGIIIYVWLKSIIKLFTTVYIFICVQRT